MQGPRAALILSAGELRVTQRCSGTWYGQEGGRVCTWSRKPQPLEPRTSYPVPWSWARRSEYRPPETLPWPGPASARPFGARADGQSLGGSQASARRLCRALESLSLYTHGQGARDLRHLGSRHTPALDDAPLLDGEALCDWPILAQCGSGEDEKTWGGGTGGREKSSRHPDEG